MITSWLVGGGGAVEGKRWFLFAVKGILLFYFWLWLLSGIVLEGELETLIRKEKYWSHLWYKMRWRWESTVPLEPHCNLLRSIAWYEPGITLTAELPTSHRRSCAEVDWGIILPSSTPPPLSHISRCSWVQLGVKESFSTQRGSVQLPEPRGELITLHPRNVPVSVPDGNY